MNRITYGMSIQRTLLDQHRNMFNMNDILRAMSSNRLYHKPSDSPIQVSRIMRLQTELKVNELYSGNIDGARSWTRKTDDSLRNIKLIIDRIKDLTIRAANGTLSDVDKQQIEAEYIELKKSAITIGNDDYMGRHQFSGHKTDMKFVTEDGRYNTDLNLAGLKYENMEYIIGVSQTSRINFSGVEVFGHEYYHTNTRSENKIPFSDDNPTTILGGSMDITIQKYKQLYSDSPKEQRPADYENDKILEEKLNGPITFENITYYANYDKDDINSVVEDMNKSLRDKIAIEAKGKYPDPATAEVLKQRKEYETELRNAIQFVNDNGKIALVTDNDYGVQAITPKKLDLKKIEGKVTAEVDPEPNKKVPLENKINYADGKKYGYLPVAISFNINDFITYETDENGDLKEPVTEKTKHTVDDIVFAKTYKMTDSSDDRQMADLIAYELQAEIDKKIREYNSKNPNKIAYDDIKVVVGDDNNINIVTDKYNDITIVNKSTSGDNYIEAKLKMTPATNPSGYTPKESKHLNNTSILDFKIDPPITNSQEDYVFNIGFALEVTTYPTINAASGDLLYVGHLRNLETIKKEIEDKENYFNKFPKIVTDKEQELADRQAELPVKQTELDNKTIDYDAKVDLYNTKKEELNQKYPLLEVGKDENDPLYKLREQLKDPSLTPDQRKSIQEQIDKEIKRRREEVNTLNKELTELTNEISALKDEIGSLKSDISRINSDIATLPKEISKLKEDEINLPTEIDQLKKEKKKIEDILAAAGANPDGKLDLSKEVKSEFKIMLVNKYKGDEKQIEAQIREDIENQIKDQLADINKERIENGQMQIGYNDISVTFNNDDISIKINKDMGYTFKDGPKPLDIKEFGDTDPLGEPEPEDKNVIELPIVINTDVDKDDNKIGDTHVYMDLNLKITEYEKDQFGDEQKTKPKNPIEIDEIVINKKYPRVKPGSNPMETYKDGEIKDMVFNDAKEAIEAKINSLNPPIQKNGIKIVRDGDNIKIEVSPDIKVELSYDKISDPLAGNPHLEKAPDYVPSANEEKKPEREMMPFFEMMDRLIYMAHNGDSEGLDRMLEVIDWHANNNLKVQGQGGGRVNMYNIMTERTRDLKLNYSELLSDTRDTDYAEASAQLSLLSYVYRASLAVTAKIIQPSLVDFLR